MKTDLYKFYLMLGELKLTPVQLDILINLDKKKNMKELLSLLSKNKILSSKSYSNVFRTVSNLKERGFVKFEKQKYEKGSPKYICLTQKGAEVLKLHKELIKKGAKYL